MANKSRSVDDAVNNYTSSTSAKATFWKNRAVAADWAGPAGSDQAETNYSNGVQKAIQNKTRKTAIQQTGNQVYASGIEAGASRYSSGTAAAATKVRAALTKIIQDINSVPLPPRGPRGSDVNIMQRGTAIQKTLAANRGKYKVRGVAKTATGV